MRAVFKVIAVLFLFGVAGVAAWRMLKPRKPNVVVILLDTLRADHVGSYGYSRDTTPNLDKFGAEFNRAANAISSAPWTPAATLSILTGMYVESHGYMPPSRSVEARRSNATVNQSLYVLPEILRDNGYSTAAISSNAWITKELGFTQGFDQFTYRNSVPGQVVTKEARMALRKFKETGEQFFLYVHYLDPHHPYEPPPRHRIYNGQTGRWAYDDKQTGHINNYDGEIHSVDAQVGNLLGFLKELELFDDAIIVIVSDHGEQFNEHGFLYHGNQVYNTEIRVPLFYKLGKNGPRGQVIEHTVSSIDIFATILTAVGIPVPQSAALSIPLTDTKRQGERAGVFSSIKGRLNQRSFTAYDGRKLIIGTNNPNDKDAQSEDPTRNIIGVFDSSKDFFEQTAIDSPEDLLELQEEWKKLYSKAAKLMVLNDSNDSSGITDEALKQLQSLGYLN